MTSITGPKVQEFEEKYAAAFGAKYALATCNGVVAIHLALAALEIGPGDEVIVPAHTFIGTSIPVLMANAIPVFVDIARDIAELQARFPGAPTVMHVGANEPAIIDMMAALRTTPVRIECVRAERDKHTRAQPYAAAWNDGRVPVPICGEWADERDGGQGLASLLVAEHVAFTGEDNAVDDTVDACSSAWARLASRLNWLPRQTRGFSSATGLR